MISGEQIKAARDLLGWSRSRLAARSRVSDGAVGWFEGGKRARESTIVKIRCAITDAGVEFPQGEPPRLMPGGQSGDP